MPLADKYEESVTHKRVSTTQNSHGEDVITLSTVGTHNARVRPLSGREKETFLQIWGTAQFVIEMDPKRCGLAEGDILRQDRFVWKSYTLNVLDAQLSNGRNGEWSIITSVLVQ